MSQKLSTVKVRETQESKTVNISGTLKPKIVKDVINKWQSLIDITAKIIGVPSGLIMRLNEETIQVFVNSHTKDNPYKVGEEADLIYGLYCETVIGTQQKLIVPDAKSSSIWKENNPDVDINMISYLGFPVNWPDGEVFGTVCLLDNKENHYNEQIEELLINVKYSLETDLKLLLSNLALKKKNVELDKSNQLKSKFLSLISHDIRGSIGTLNEFLNFYLSHPATFTQKELIKLLTMLSGSTNTAYTTLENLLNWSKNNMLDIKVEKKQINLVDVIHNVIAFFKQNIELKKQKLSVEIDSENIAVYADEKMLETALRNILSNAVKYTELGGKLFIRAKNKDNKVVIEIEDSGIGMTENTISKLFSYDDFHQQHGTNNETSSGIGLLLMKEFLDKNDAKVTVESELGKGTKFKIRI